LLVKKIYPHIFYSIDEENISKLEVKMNGQIDPSLIYNENQRDYTETTNRTLFIHEWNEFASKNYLTLL